MKYQIITFGCQFNQADQERLITILEQAGFEAANSIEQADLVVVFACSVRQSAIDRLYGLKAKFNQIRKTRPLITVLSGCVLKSDRPKLAGIFDFILETKNLSGLPKLLKAKSDQLSAKSYFRVHPAYQSKFEAYVPIMTGCNNFCSYCVVPYTRGREVSRPTKEVLREVKNLVAKGYRLITLIGQNVNSYKSRQNGRLFTFPKLLKMVDEIPGRYWLSFATSHPKDMSDELIRVMAQARHLIPYLHLPIQAGDDEILRQMNRRYTASHYRGLIAKVRKAMPGINVSTDVIVGFPNETRAQFQRTLKLFKEIKFDMAYLARYSPRAGTAAAKMIDDVSQLEKKRREETLNAVLKKTALVQNKKMVGRHFEVLVESSKVGFCFGKTKNFKNVKFQSESDLTGKIVINKIIGCYAWGLNGVLPKVLVILGPTSSGKTKLAVRLAKKFQGEIISADSRQVYIGMDIGTGKDLEEYGKIPYHLIDVADPKSQFTVAEWQKQAYEAINDILRRGRLPIVCGGTGLYLSALVEGYDFQVTRDKEQETRNKLDKLSLPQLLTRLEKVDLATYRIIDKNNRRRVQRALEIYYETGQPKSAQLRKTSPPYDFLQIGLTFPKTILYQRIDERLRRRIEKEGMIGEIKRLHYQGVSWQKLEEFGLEYRFVSRYLQKKISKEEMFTQLSRAIKNFAKRQMTWFSRSLPEKKSESRLPSGKRDENIIWGNNYKQIENLVKRFIR